MKNLTIDEAKTMMKRNGGHLNLSGTQIQSLPDNLTVGGYLDLSETQIQSLPDNLTVGDSLLLNGTQIQSLPDNLTVGGSLYLYGTQIQSLPDNLTVGGYLDLRGTQIQSLPDNLTVGGYLDLRGTQIQSLPDNLTAGVALLLSGTQIQSGYYKRLEHGDYVPKKYLYADGILTHIKSRRTLKGYVFYKGKIKGKNVISDGVNYAHCSTLREGIAELLFKTASDRGAEQYKGLTLDTELSLEEMKTMYRVITGACKQGTESFIANLGDKLKDKYSIREAIELTEGQYNSDAFKNFFEE